MNARPSARRATSPAELAFATMYGLPAHLAAILASLSTGGVVSALRVHICALRKALPSEAIDTQPGGYQLTEIGRDACKETLAEFQSWVRAKGRAA